jgi:flagellar basal body rod protein FlgG
MKEFSDTLSGQMGSSPLAEDDLKRAPIVTAYRSVIDFTQGAIRHTGNPLDAALRNANDFFVVSTPQGQQYTRAGNFAISQNGELVTQDGERVVGDGGNIQIGAPGAEITQDGSIRVQGIIVGRLQVVRFDKTDGLEAVSGSRFRRTGPAPVQVEPYVEPRAVEQSNASVVTGMIDLISTNRAFDAYSKAAQTIDSLNQAAISQVGRRTS